MTIPLPCISSACSITANFEVRLAAVQFFGGIRKKQIAQVLIPVLSDSSVDVRQATAAALGRDWGMACA